MSENAPDDNEISVQLANEIIGIANQKMEEGVHPIPLAAALRHAAANFSAFAHTHADQDSLDPQGFAEDFFAMLQHYKDVHLKSIQPASGLEQLVEQVKNETP